MNRAPRSTWITREWRAAFARRMLAVRASHFAMVSLHVMLFSNLVWLMPMLARQRFGASDTQTILITASVPTFMMLSVFWSEQLRARALRHQLALFWLFAALPFGLVGVVTSYWQLLACHVVSCIGFAAWSPIHGRLLKLLYPDRIRGRLYSLIAMLTALVGMGSVYGLGVWIDHDENAFRYFNPVVAAGYLVSMLALARLAGPLARAAPVQKRPRSLARVFEPVLHMGSILRQDTRFFRYELAFMTYGVAFMFCDALLPIFATDYLQMSQGEYAHSTQFIAKFAGIFVILPVGFLYDRIGAVRLTGYSFLMLAGFPLLLVLSANAGVLPTAIRLFEIAMALFGIGLAGVGMGWMLGPVTLAGSADRVPQYTAIHATLVGIRGVLFQAVGLGLYKASGFFTVPFVIAVGGLLFAAWQMRLLQRKMSATDTAAEASDPTPQSSRVGA